MRYLLLIVALLLSACATGVWVNKGVSNEQAQRDGYECQRDGEQYAANIGANGNPLIAAMRIRDCMKMKGYTLQPK
jgi:hypothetical protein